MHIYTHRYTHRYTHTYFIHNIHTDHKHTHTHTHTHTHIHTHTHQRSVVISRGNVTCLLSVYMQGMTGLLGASLKYHGFRDRPRSVDSGFHGPSQWPVSRWGPNAGQWWERRPVTTDQSTSDHWPVLQYDWECSVFYKHLDNVNLSQSIWNTWTCRLALAKGVVCDMSERRML